MNRRNVLMGLGTIVVGGGAALGSGAFSTVEADRTINVESAGDGSAYVGLSAAAGAEDFVTGGGEDEIEIDIGALEDADGEGINKNARTEFAELVEITNNTNNDITEINVDTDNENIDVLGEAGETLGESDNLIEENLTNGNSVTFGLAFDLRDGVTQDDLNESTLTITVEADANGGN